MAVWFCVCLSKRYLSLTACNAMSGGFGRNESGRWNCRLRSDLSPSTRTHDGGSEDQDDIRRKVDQKNEKKKKSRNKNGKNEGGGYQEEADRIR